ncbi:MAG TPA: DUF4062 domain-containing protein [Ktedonobacterales bacterium]
MLDDDATRTSSPRGSSVAVAIATQPDTTQQPGFWRWVARAVLSLWWLFVVALAAGTASYLGNRAGPALVPLLPRLLNWVRGQSLIVQAGLILAALVLLAVMAWLTVLAWRQRQQRVVEEVKAGIQRQTAAFEGALDRDVNPRLDGIHAGVEQIAVQGETIKGQQQTLLGVATDTRAAVESLHQEIGDLARRTEHASITRRVFISSTYVDLHAYRARLHEALERMEQFPVDMVNFGAGGGDATTVSRACYGLGVDGW